ncbi:MAG: prolyl oligopeptidase family serine peptidase [Clostridia bacterium]|nr:prolyl oligopeptidase family serine peptidase [Clostridia bacterium]
MKTERPEKAEFDKFFAADLKYINKDTVELYCNSNAALLRGCGWSGGEDSSGSNGRPKALVLEFPGLGGNSCLGGSMDELSVYDNPFTRACAAQGIAVAYMFPGPWSWMNRGAVRITDLVVNAFMQKFGWESDDDFSLVVMGGSMGGQAALIYSIDSAHKVRACAAHCPCCDVGDCFRVLDEFPRTFLSAVNCYDMPLDDALKLISPVERISELPDIPYLITADELDVIIPLEGLEKYVKRLTARGLNVNYMRLDNMGHGGISDADRERLNEFVVRNCLSRE